MPAISRGLELPACGLLCRRGAGLSSFSGLESPESRLCGVCARELAFATSMSRITCWGEQLLCGPKTPVLPGIRPTR